MLWPKEKPIIDIVGEWVFYPIPHQTQLIEALNKNKARQFELRRQVREGTMDFKEAVEAAKKGVKLRRPCWEPDMWMAWFQGTNQGFLVHSHPYWEHQESATEEGSFVYVTENDDAIASDWERVCA